MKGEVSALSSLNGVKLKPTLAGSPTLILACGGSYEGSYSAEEYLIKRNKWSTLPSLGHSTSDLKASCVLDSGFVICFDLETGP